MAKFFSISIGNRGSIITLRNKKKVFEEYTFESIDTEENKKILEKLFKKHKKLLVYIILDNVGQNYSKKIIPSVTFFDAMKIVERKFIHEIPKSDLKEKRLLGRNKDTKEWEYMFISSPIDGYLQEWLNYIEQTENILNGIYMLPLEFETILKNINNKVNIVKTKSNADKKKKKTTWTTVIIENFVSGYREITFANNRLVFTRILQEDFIDDGENFSRYFKEDISQTTEYLKRFYQDFNTENLTVYIISSTEKKNIIKDCIANEDFYNIKIKNFSFYDISNMFGLDKKKYEASKYGDILFQDLISANKKIISFSTRDMKQLVLLSHINNFLFNLSYVFLISLVFIFLSFTFFVVSNKYNKINASKSLDEANKLLMRKEKENFGGNIPNLDEIIDFVSFYNEVLGRAVDPFDFLIKFSTTVNDNFIVNNLKWQMIGLRKNDLTINTKLFQQVDISLINKTGKIDDLFKVYESTENAIKSTFGNNNVKIPNLPKNINFNTNYFSFPLKIEFTEN